MVVKTISFLTVNRGVFLPVDIVTKKAGVVNHVVTHKVNGNVWVSLTGFFIPEGCRATNRDRDQG